MDKVFLEEIIYRYKHPLHRGKNSGQKIASENVSCGDKITIYLEIFDDKIVDAKFDGSLCSIANYGAELLLDKIIGQKITELSQINSADLLGEIGASLLQNPVRLKCFELAQIALNELKSASQKRI
ncbi:MAG: iron-sulfur cluster assembly scaffold protein [Candidatus Nomurabacteria bacterium]|jgi:NifU-like protein involved in Fe-S cluster formation|nr:iron-sulfur cluster assembly scaffold protein [Candidatus Nomurabacteria bacterium]